MYKIVYNTLDHHSCKLETNKYPPTRDGINKIVTNAYNEILFNHKTK